MKRMNWFLLLLAAAVSLGVFPSYAQGEDACKKIEIAGTSSISWENATIAAVETISKSVPVTTAEVVYQDVTVENGQVMLFRVTLKVCAPFKFP